MRSGAGTRLPSPRLFGATKRQRARERDVGRQAGRQADDDDDADALDRKSVV